VHLSYFQTKPARPHRPPPWRESNRHVGAQNAGEAFCASTQFLDKASPLLLALSLPADSPSVHFAPREVLVVMASLYNQPPLAHIAANERARRPTGQTGLTYNRK
jgi:hypothetical protein